MESVGNEHGMINFGQSAIEKFKTKMEVDTVNKAIKKDGKEVVQTMGKDQFLKLLITEMQHQDPTNPMQDREFIAQMAQFSSLEQMVNFNEGMNKLIGNMNFQQS
ncbi:MAG TPA: flagellar hook capping FlgD N-terminal domain-containing protein, partial [Spirochaetota bacterium]|nr:flagellar hook capping FlgD N-terminal domain-containing protein [Spirochaetota bacterium]